MLALKVGIFANVNGCLVILQPEGNRSVTLVWPADSSVTIQADGATVVTGLVTGNLKEQFLKFAEVAWFGGGLLDEVSDDLKQTTAPHCQGPYWVVGFDLGPGEPPY